ncbi:hypothetical protein MLD38_006322 [Melastoma candidum]|uniref:Uncharacterized protein n=1 Tax=Melastoma candidum TaxID=119954 RepID=A0ACB9RM54_9MYRT|nr:hypothetical protein MLD38_006322 [Melastoma candidum]
MDTSCHPYPLLLIKSDGLKLLSVATVYGGSSWTRFKRKNAETVTKSLTKLLVKRLKGQVTFTPSPSAFVSRKEIDEVLADGDFSTIDTSDHQLTTSKRVDFAWLFANMLDIYPVFEALSLKTFCELYVEVFVAKVLVFYSNLNFYRDGRSIKFIRTSVNGVTLVYSALDVCNLVLHRAVLFSLLPHAGSIDTILLVDAKVMVLVLEGISFSLGALIFEHMVWSLSRREKSLSYGQVIVGLLQMHDIDPTLASEQYKWKVGNSMQYVKTTEGWRTKAQHYEFLQKKTPSALLLLLRARNMPRTLCKPGRFCSISFLGFCLFCFALCCQGAATPSCCPR